MGRASNRKKAQRQSGGPNLRRIKQDARSQAVTQGLPFSLDAMVRLAGERAGRSIALQAWLGDAEPVPAEVPPWPEGSLGRRLLAGTPMGEAQGAPSLLTSPLPDTGTIAADPRHWPVATSVLIRAVIFDGLTPGHPAVSALLEALTPVVEAEVAHMQDMDDDLCDIEPFENYHRVGFPELDGPVYLLGRALVEAVWATVGDDSLPDVDSMLELALDGVVPGLDSQSLVSALIAASYTVEPPVGARHPYQLTDLSENPLAFLVLDDEVPPKDILRAGLLVLSALARLCQSSSNSVL
jgi:hypothetical protein